MASLLTILLIFCFATSQIEARESVFFSKMNPVRRYSQLVSTSIPALAPLISSESTPAPAPAPAPSSSEIESPSENYVYGFYGQEVGEFPVATTKADANANTTPKMTRGDNLVNNDARFETVDEGQRYEASSNSMYSKFNNYEDDEHRSSNGDYRGRYDNNNVRNKYTRSYDDRMYGSNYDQYTDENNYYADEFERTEPRTIGGRRFVDNGRYYSNGNGNGYYDSRNEYNSMEVYEGVYQP